MPGEEAIMAAVAGGGNLLSSIIPSAANVYSTILTNQANKELAQYAYTRDVAMWEKNNQYNSPIQQMQRLQKAGLNPNLVYGNGSVVGNTSGQIPKYNAPEMHAPQVGSIGIAEAINAIQHYRLTESALANQDASRREKEQTIVNKVIDQGIKEADRARKNFDLQKAKNLEQNSYDVANQNLQNLKTKQHLMATQDDATLARKLLTEKQAAGEDYRNELRQYHVNENDNLIFRLFMQLMSKSGGLLPEKYRDYSW